MRNFSIVFAVLLCLGSTRESCGQSAASDSAERIGSREMLSREQELLPAGGALVTVSNEPTEIAIFSPGELAPLVSNRQPQGAALPAANAFILRVSVPVSVSELYGPGSARISINRRFVAAKPLVDIKHANGTAARLLEMRLPCLGLGSQSVEVCYSMESRGEVCLPPLSFTIVPPRPPQIVAMGDCEATLVPIRSDRRTVIRSDTLILRLAAGGHLPSVVAYLDGRVLTPSDDAMCQHCHSQPLDPSCCHVTYRLQGVVPPGVYALTVARVPQGCGIASEPSEPILIRYEPQAGYSEMVRYHAGETPPGAKVLQGDWVDTLEEVHRLVQEIESTESELHAVETERASEEKMLKVLSKAHAVLEELKDASLAKEKQALDEKIEAIKKKLDGPSKRLLTYYQERVKSLRNNLTTQAKQAQEYHRQIIDAKSFGALNLDRVPQVQWEPFLEELKERLPKPSEVDAETEDPVDPALEIEFPAPAPAVPEMTSPFGSAARAKSPFRLAAGRVGVKVPAQLASTESTSSVDWDQASTIVMRPAFQQLPEVKVVSRRGSDSEPTSDARLGTYEYRFHSAAHFPRSHFGPQREVSRTAGAVIYEGMRFSARSDGTYEVEFLASSPALPVLLQLQLQVQHAVSQRWHTITMPPIELPASPGDAAGSRSHRIFQRGYSSALEMMPLGERLQLRRSGKATFGFGANQFREAQR